MAFSELSADVHRFAEEKCKLAPAWSPGIPKAERRNNGYKR